MSTPTVERIGTGLAVLPSVNLLPPEIIQRKRLRQVQVACGGAGVVAVAVVAAATLLAAAGVGPAQDNLAAANAKQAALQKQSQSYAGVTSTYAQADQVDKLIATASQGEIHWTNLLNELSTTTPKNVWLTNIVIGGAGGTGPATSTPSATSTGSTTASTLPSLTFSGYALSHDAVAGWLDVLAKQKGLASSYLSKSDQQTKGTTNVYEFTITVLVTSDALQSSAATGGN